MKHNLLKILFLVALAGAASGQGWVKMASIPAQFTFPVVAVADGKIHIMGGGGKSGATNLHYAYDPAKNKWEQKANTPFLAQQPAGATVDGKIHFFGGGYPNSGSPIDSHYVYDPTTDSWERATPLSSPRAIHDAEGVDGKLYSMGGQSAKDALEVYDPSTEKWTKLGNLPDQNFWYSAHAVADGKIYRFCGGGYTSPVSAAHSYDPSTDSWTSITQFPKAVHAMSGAAIGDKIYLVGGYFDFEPRAEMWIYDTKTKSYSDGKPLPIGRNYHRVVAVDGCIYSLGGNHPLDDSVTFELLKWCPWPAGESEPAYEKLTARYEAGTLVLTLPESGILTQKEVRIYNMSGSLVVQESALSTLKIEIPLHLTPALYVVQVGDQERFFSTKFLIQQ